MNSRRPRIISRKPPPPTKPKPKQKDPVEVYCRLRPLRDHNENVCAIPITNTIIQLSPPDAVACLRNGAVKETQYTFKFVFDEKTSQKALFDHVALPIVSDLLAGRNGLLFTYGVTGSGKTFTMTGTPQNGGILPRSLDILFNSIGDLQTKKYVFKPDKMNSFDVQSEADAMLDRQKDLSLTSSLKLPKTPRRKDIPEVEERIPDTNKLNSIDEDNNYAVFVSYIEIYNNYVYDLLEDIPIDPVKPKPLQSKILREDAAHNMYVHGCTEVEVKSTDEAFDAFYKGQKRRRVAHTTLNTESSRSHSVFTIRLVQAPLDNCGEEVLQEKGAVCISQLSLVDLAGSERTIRTKTTGDRLREAGNINTSLMVLRTCIEILRENQATGSNKMVPYRDAKLTHLFKNFFDGEGKVRMVVCVNASVEDYDENLHVMRFAELTQEVMIARPTAPRLDLGLTPGRRRANLIYKEAIEKLNEMKSTPQVAASVSAGDNGSSSPPRSLSERWPLFPHLELHLTDDEDTIPALIEHLELRKQQRQYKMQELGTKQSEFRERLVDMERKHVLLLLVEDLKAQVDSRTQKLKATERNLTNVEQVNEILQRKVNQYEKAKNNLEQELDQRDMLLNQGELEKVKLRARMQDRMMTERERMTREMAKRVRAKETEFKTKMWRTDAKLQTLRDIVNDKWKGPESGGPDQPGCKITKSVSRSDPKLNTYEGPVTRSTVRRSISPERITSVPVANLRHRRSRSANGDVWLEHNPPGNVELGTLLQPQIKKRKSVTKLTMKDVTKEASKYVLAHQQQDNLGEIETHYYKGSVIPSAGGGAQVVFNDVEMLRQTSPGSRKRSADGQQVDHQTKGGSEEWPDIQTRCAVGIEGHSAKKYCD